MNDHARKEPSYAWNAPKVVCQIIDGEAILIHFEKGHYFSAMDSGTWAIELLELGLNVDEMAETFADHFGIDLDRGRQDLVQFLNQLITEDLVVLKPRDATVVDRTTTAGASGPRSESHRYTRPVLVKYTDLEDLLALDPVHDVIIMTDEQKYSELERSFERARQSTEICTYDVELGGRDVRLHFAGRELLDLLTPAVAHLRTDRGRIELNLFIADSESTGINPRLDPESFGDDLIQNTQASPQALRCTYVPTSDMYCCLHPERASAYIWVQSRNTLQDWDISAPFRPLLGWWAESVGAQLAHGAVIGTQQAAIFLGGASGAGKSTITLACLKHGLFTLGDDYVWIEPGDPVRACSLYCTVKIAHPDLQSHFAEFTTYAHHSENEKTCLHLSRVPAVGLRSSLPLRAMAALRISGKAEPRIRDASAIEVLNSVVPSSLRQLSGSTLSGLQRFGQIVGTTRALIFEAGTDYAANAQALANFLSELSNDAVHVREPQSTAADHSGIRQAVGD